MPTCAARHVCEIELRAGLSLNVSTCMSPSCRDFPEMVFDLTPTLKWEWWLACSTIASQKVCILL